MDQHLELTRILEQAIMGYHTPVLKGKSYYFHDPKEQVFVVLGVPDHFPRKFDAGIVVMARVGGEKIVIEEDTTDRPLTRELMRAGIPREQIICTYLGETLPEDSSEPTTP